MSPQNSGGPIFQELQERITRLQNLLSAREFGLFLWQSAVQEQMKSLIEWWEDRQ